MTSRKTKMDRVDLNRIRHKTVQGYEQLKEIGSGSFGIVYLVRKGRQEFAMKAMDLSYLQVKDTEHCLRRAKPCGDAPTLPSPKLFEFAMKAMNLSRLEVKDTEHCLQEGETMKRCDHPNLVTLHEFFQQDKKLYIVMEHCAGGSLKDYLARIESNLDEAEVVAFMIDVCRALQFLHQNGLIHRDVKTANIFLTKDRKLKLGDMALTREYKEDFSMTSLPGTPVYMSPEVIQCQKYDQKADVWSAGCCFFEMCHRRGLFSFASSFETLKAMMKMTETKAMNTNTIQHHVCGEMDRLFKAMISYHARNRPTIDDVLECLETHTHDSPTRAPITTASHTYSTASTLSAKSSTSSSLKSSKSSASSSIQSSSTQSSSSSSSSSRRKTSARRSPNHEPGATGGGGGGGGDSLRGSRLERQRDRHRTSDYETDTERHEETSYVAVGVKEEPVAVAVTVWMTEDEHGWYKMCTQLQENIKKKVLDEKTMKKIKEELRNTKDMDDEKQFMTIMEQHMDEVRFRRCKLDLKALWGYNSNLSKTRFKLAF